MSKHQKLRDLKSSQKRKKKHLIVKGFKIQPSVVFFSNYHLSLAFGLPVTLLVHRTSPLPTLSSPMKGKTAAIKDCRLTSPSPSFSPPPPAAFNLNLLFYSRFLLFILHSQYFDGGVGRAESVSNHENKTNKKASKYEYTNRLGLVSRQVK